MTEQRYKAVLAVIADGRTVTEVAKDWGVSRQTMHGWLARYEEEGLEGLTNRSHRPAHSPHRIPAVLEAMVLEMRRADDLLEQFALGEAADRNSCFPKHAPSAIRCRSAFRAPRVSRPRCIRSYGDDGRAPLELRPHPAPRSRRPGARAPEEP